MIRGMRMRWTLAMAGLMTVAVARASGGGPDDTRPFEVRVVDMQQKDVPKIDVEVAAPDPGRPRRSFTTDNDGLVTIPPGIAIEGAVLSDARGWEGMAWAQVGDPAQSFHHDGTQGIPIVMRLLPLTHKVEGTVVDLQGKPIGGVRIGVQELVQSTNRLLEQDLGRKDPLLGFVDSDPSGKFAVNLPEGARAVLRAVHPRHVGPAIQVAVDAQTLNPVTLVPAGGIVGKLTDATTGKPVAGATVASQFLDRRPVMLSDGWDQAVTDAEGRFAMQGRQPGVYNVFLLEVPGRRHATATAVEGVRVDGGSEATASLSVIEGHPMRGVVIDRVNGRPIAGAQVGCQGAAVPQSGAAIMGTTTDARGRFTFYVPPGEQFVYLIDDVSSARMSRRVVVVPEQGEIIPLRLLQPPPSSFDAVTSEIPEGAVTATTTVVVERAVRVAAPAPAPAPASAPARALAFARDFAVAVAAPAPAPAAAKAAGPAPAVFAPTPMNPAAAVAVAPAPAPVPAPAEKPVPSRTITGRVRDAKGRPIIGLRVALETRTARAGNLRDRLDSVATDREGRFVLHTVRRDAFSISLSRPRYRVQSEVIPADRDEVELTYRFPADDNLRNQSALIEDESIPAELLPRLTFVDLTPYGTNYLTDGPAPAGDGNNLDRLPRGMHKLADSYFRIGETMVQVKGQASPNWPESVTRIKVAARGAKLHILHSAQQQTEPGTELGNYVIQYADGAREKIPIIYGRNLVDWWHFPSQKNDPTDAKIAWTGSNEMVDGRKADKLEVRLYAVTWTNPHPEKEIATIDVVSSNSNCDPYLIAVTLERSVGH
jgi:hypothetical protein